MTFSSNTYTFYAQILQQCLGLRVNRIEDLRCDLHPKPSYLIDRIKNKKKPNNVQNCIDLTELPVFRREEKRKRRPSFMIGSTK